MRPMRCRSSTYGLVEYSIHWEVGPLTSVDLKEVLGEGSTSGWKTYLQTLNGRGRDGVFCEMDLETSERIMRM